MFRLFFILTFTAYHLIIVAAVNNCDACIQGSCYRKLIVLEHFEQVGQLAHDHKSNILYFHVKDNARKSYTCAFDLTNVDLHRIWDIDFSYARTVDQKTGDVYISDVVSVWKMNTKADFIGDTVFNGTVWHMQYKDKLYYSEFSANGMKYFENETHKEVEGLSQYKVEDFVIDKNNDIYFVSDFTLYKLKNGETKPKKISDETYTLAIDKYGEVYALQPFTRALYKIDMEDQLKEFGAFANGSPYKLVFNSDNYIIYSDVEFEGMYLLLPGTGKCLVSDVGSGKSSRKMVSNVV